MNYLGFLFYLSSTVGWTETQAPIEAAPIFLGKGEQRHLSTEGLKRFSLSGDSVRATELNENSLLIRGEKLGTSDLWVWKTDGSVQKRLITVQKWELPLQNSELLRALDSTLGNENIEIIYFPKGVMARGIVSKRSTFEKLCRLQKLFQDSFVLEVKVDPSLQAVIRSEIATLFPQRPPQLAKSSDFRFQEPFWQLPRMPYAGQLPPCVRMDEGIGEGPVPILTVEIYLLEVSQKNLTQFGLRWPDSVEGAIHATPWNLTPEFSLAWAIDLLETTGQARILSHPELMVKVPGKAELFAGGEIPVKNRTKQTMHITWKPYGLLLKLDAEKATEQEVRLSITTEVSHLDIAHSSDDAPALRTNRIQTQIDATFGVPVLLSGLLQNESAQEIAGLPGLKDIPILGALFGSESFLKRETEFVAILVPYSKSTPVSLKKVLGVELPRGPNPAPRESFSLTSFHQSIRHPDYPWNLLQ